MRASRAAESGSVKLIAEGSKHAGFAGAWWDLEAKKGLFEDDLIDLLGGDYTHIGGDGYDNSLEIYGVEDHVRLSEDAQRLIQGAGFSKVYVNHLDGGETHYTWDWREPEFKVARGWRRKAKPDGKGFWISFWPAAWDATAQCADWLSSGYMEIVPDPLEPTP